MKASRLPFRFSLILGFLLLGSVTSLAGENAKPMKQEDSFSNWQNKPREPFSKGAENFEKAKNELLKNYYRKDISEADLYRAAVQGMLTHVDPEMKEWNTLYSPAEHQELMSDMGGEISGVGMQTAANDMSGYSYVAGTVPGSPAEKAGIKRGDIILKVDNKSYRNKQLRDLVYAIRGKPGTEVKLTLFHDEAVKEFTLKRQQLSLRSSRLTMLDDGVGHLSIESFTNRSSADLKSILQSLKEKGVKSLIVDLRGNDGGLFDTSIESIKMFVPKGKTIVKMTERGPVTKEIKNNDEPLVTNMPLVVLMNTGTRSGGEIMAAALKMSAGATTVGTHTFGKWSAQRLEELPNKFAIKYTIATFLPPEGPDLTGKGLIPDINVALPDEAMNKMPNMDDVKSWIASDVQLQAALNVLKTKK